VLSTLGYLKCPNLKIYKLKLAQKPILSPSWALVVWLFLKIQVKNVDVVRQFGSIKFERLRITREIKSPQFLPFNLHYETGLIAVVRSPMKYKGRRWLWIDLIYLCRLNHKRQTKKIPSFLVYKRVNSKVCSLRRVCEHGLHFCTEIQLLTKFYGADHKEKHLTCTIRMQLSQGA